MASSTLGEIVYIRILCREWLSSSLPISARYCVELGGGGEAYCDPVLLLPLSSAGVALVDHLVEQDKYGLAVFEGAKEGGHGSDSVLYDLARTFVAMQRHALHPLEAWHGLAWRAVLPGRAMPF